MCIRDSSSNVLTNDDYVITGERRLIRGITGDAISVPLVELTVECQLCTGTYLCGLVSTLPVGIELLVGNDLWSDPVVAEVNVMTRSMTVAKTNTTGREPPPHPPGEDLPADEITQDISSLFEEYKPTIETMNRDQLIELQQRDSNLKPLFALVDKPGHDYLIHSGVLLCKWRDNVSTPSVAIHQIVVPTQLRPKLLYIAHDIPAAGHLGVAKTKARLQRHFYWPGISSDVKEFCRTCNVCQRLGKGISPSVAPLHSLPVVSEPFCQNAIDIIGPLPQCKDSGSRFILTVLDLCTHYPEAIPLTSHMAQDVAKALGTVFTRFGFPQEILSDQGSDFMSVLMQVFLSEFKINQIRTSPYHPQTNGACERFNGTLKSTIKSLTEQFSDSWDEALPWVFFVYREVPVETLGCSMNCYSDVRSKVFCLC